ncbi:hypothetical protein B857_03778 [Solibacillus isronensis B3W22]|uniref:Uncharacterized protein n=1 Tax=Solibacillus isronensis B3W22 TaxID=1224748 RepID=K1KXR8_9BACL|nr:hypothetical protein B857_03778 [Solibacillus isronensis B3W22]
MFPYKKGVCYGLGAKLAVFLIMRSPMDVDAGNVSRDETALILAAVVLIHKLISESYSSVNIHYIRSQIKRSTGNTASTKNPLRFRRV